MNKSTSMMILLGIDVVFFLLEIIVGYLVHSLALVADSFHMLNDILTLIVGLWAVKAAQSKGRSNSFTYGWKRAETLGALINGVFLIALCVSIVLEAIQRFFEPQEVQKPMVVLIVGSFGLASNIVGLFLFHDHGHSHGSDGGHSHDSHALAEEGHAHSHDAETQQVADERGRGADTLKVSDYGTAAQPKSIGKSIRSRSRGHSQSIHPGSLRAEILDEAQRLAGDVDEEAATEETGLLSPAKGSKSSHSHATQKHKAHNHAQPKKAGSGGHSHGDLNMRGVFLHVLGDALGNVGVIATALIIWLTKFSWRFYADPAISLVITLIILHTAIPLVKAASRILLQGVPESVDIEQLQEDIEGLEGVESAHDIHVWQLSDTTVIASLHVQVSFNFEGEGSQRYMRLAREVRECLHGYGIHSSTIQPEFIPSGGSGSVDGRAYDGSEYGSDGHTHTGQVSKKGSQAGSMRDSCLLDCADLCGDKNVCCPPDQNSKAGNSPK